MSRIRILPVGLRNKIAAGEIVERPASVLKELAENSIDAGSRKIDVELEDGGRGLIRVTDDGSGMDREDVCVAFERHATSKIREEGDLELVRTLGFRGEAIPSMASVSRFRVITAPAGSSRAFEVRGEGGKIDEVKEAVSPAGTLFEVADLFYNTPARKKFMKTSATELSHCMRVFQHVSLPHPGIHFTMRHNGKELSDFSAVATLRERVFQVVGPDWMDQLSEWAIRRGSVSMSGFVSAPPFSFSSREHQDFFVNRRAVRSPLLSHAVAEALSASMMKGRHPMAIVYIEAPPESLDVNVHPAKREVRFHQQQQVHDLLRNGIRDSLRDLLRPVLVAESSPTGYGQVPALEDRSMGTGGGDHERPFPEASPWNTVPVQGTLSPGMDIPVGQLDGTYIVALAGKELQVLDQHAAHERVLFDKLLDQIGQGRIIGQPLLLPETIELPQAAALRIREILPFLKESGIEIEEFGPCAFLVRSLPALLGSVSGRQLLFDLSEDAELDGEGHSVDRALQSVAASMACHAAVKAHQALGVEQIKALLRDLQSVKAPTCPHGRPIRLSFGTTDFERMFLRR